jgi:hypothetical protein
MSDQEDLFEVLMLEAEEQSIVVLVDGAEADYIFDSFAEFAEDFEFMEASHEDTCAMVLTYCAVIVPEGILEEHTPIVTRVIYSETNVILTLTLEPELLKHLTDNFENSDSVAFLFEDYGEDEPEDDDEEDDVEEDEEEDWEV